jgi:hypothetical protein
MLEINYVNFLQDRIEIGWLADIGFGVLTINKVDNHFEVETECLGSNFYNKVLEKFKEYLQDFGKIVE